MHRRSFVSLLALSTLPIAARSQEPFPSRRISIIVPYAPGSAGDNLGRVIGEGIARLTGQAVVVVNRTGANGMVAVRALQAAPRDGYTMALLVNSVMNDQVLKKAADFDIRKDLAPVARATQAPLGLFVANYLGVSSVKELIDYAKKNPGKINYGTAGIGSNAQIATERFKIATGTHLVHVPYPAGTSAFVPAMIAGDIGVLVNDMGVMRPFVADKRVKVLATLDDKRSPFYPDTPCVPELGIPELAGFTAIFFFGFFAAPGTDNSRVDALGTLVNNAIAEPATRERLLSLGYSPGQLGGTRPAEFRNAVHEELARIEQVVRTAKITVD